MEDLFQDTEFATLLAELPPCTDVETAVQHALAADSRSIQGRMAVLDRDDVLTLYTIACETFHQDPAALFVEVHRLDTDDDPAAMQARINDEYVGSSLMGFYQDEVIADTDPSHCLDDQPLDALRAAVASRRFGIASIERHGYDGITLDTIGFSNFEYINGCVLTVLVMHMTSLMLQKGRAETYAAAMQADAEQAAAEIIESARAEADLALNGARAAAALVEAARLAEDPDVAVNLLAYSQVLSEAVKWLLRDSRWRQPEPPATEESSS
jgi:hypothetical protein